MTLSEKWAKYLADPRRAESRGRYNGQDLPVPVAGDSLAPQGILDGCVGNGLDPSTLDVKDESAGH